MRTYYDHESAYRAILERGGAGWDDCPSFKQPQTESYIALDEFLAAALVPPCDAIDLGCGGGQASMRLASRGFTVTGVDFSPTAVELARRNARDAGVAATFHAADCLDLAELPTASFGLAIDNHVLHCLIGADRGRFLREAARLLRPGGVLFSDTMSRDGDFDPASLGCDPATFISNHNNRYWTTACELDSELAAAGFEIISATSRSVEPGVGDGLIRIARRAETSPVVR